MTETLYVTFCYRFDMEYSLHNEYWNAVEYTFSSTFLESLIEIFSGFGLYSKAMLEGTPQAERNEIRERNEILLIRIVK